MCHTYLRAREYGGRYYGQRRLLNRLIILLFSKVYSLNKKIKKVFFLRDECWACFGLYGSSTLVAQLTVLDEESLV